MLNESIYSMKVRNIITDTIRRIIPNNILPEKQT